MMIIGCDYHPSFEQIAFVDTETGELQELAGLNDCSPSCSLSCGSEMRRRSTRNACASKKRIARMHS